MIHKKYFFWLVLTLLPLLLPCQDLAYAKKIINTLCSPEFKGRGYVGKGDSLAAHFIAQQYEEIGLSPIGNSYFQSFNTSVNSFPKDIQVKVNQTLLRPGIDFLVDAGSPGITGKFKTICLTPTDLLGKKWIKIVKSTKKKVIVIDQSEELEFSKDQQKIIDQALAYLKFHPDHQTVAIAVITREKLTWSGSTHLNPRPTIIIQAKLIKEKIESIEFNIENKFFEKYVSQNVIGYLEGKNKDSLLVLTAHYDHLGMMGKETYFPGANDNASGIAMLLNVAQFFINKGEAEYSMAFIAFGAEEIGLIGSKYFIKHSLLDLRRIKFLINFDITGTGDDGIQVVNGTIHTSALEKLRAINQAQDLMKQVKTRGAACNSDHCFFHEMGVPCFYIYTLGGIQAYHDIYDKAETLPLTEFEDYVTLITSFLQEL